MNLTFAEVKLLPWEIWHENERIMSETLPTFVLPPKRKNFRQCIKQVKILIYLVFFKVYIA